MGVESEFAEESFIRATKCVNNARVLALSLAPTLQGLFPDMFPKPPYVEAISDQGWCNLTLRVGESKESCPYILRLAAISMLQAGKASRSLPHLEKERYIHERLKHFDFVPKIVGQGTGRCTVHIPGRGEVEYGFMLETRLPFASAKQSGLSLRRGRFLWQLGEILRQIQQPLCEGYGTDFDELKGAFAHTTYQDSVRAHLQTIEESPIDYSMRRWLRSRVEGLLRLSPEARLSHRDLLANPGNALVDERGDVRGVVDWEFASSGLPFHYEMASFLYAMSRDGVPQERIDADKRAILGGYGLSERDYRDYFERDVETIVLIHSLMSLIKFDLISKRGGIEKEPWRKLFAQRADKLCSACYSKDLPSGRLLLK